MSNNDKVDVLETPAEPGEKKASIANRLYTGHISYDFIGSASAGT